MSYRVQPVPHEYAEIPRYLRNELQRISDAVADNSEVVFYRTLPVQAASLSISNGISANWKVDGNVLLISSSNTMTLTGIQRGAFSRNREVVLFNVGTGVVVLNSEDAASSASNRFVLATTWSLSAGAAGVLWRDPFAARWRGLSKS